MWFVAPLFENAIVGEPLRTCPPLPPPGQMTPAADVPRKSHTLGWLPYLTPGGGSQVMLATVGAAVANDRNKATPITFHICRLTVLKLLMCHPPVSGAPGNLWASVQSCLVPVNTQMATMPQSKVLLGIGWRLHCRLARTNQPRGTNTHRLDCRGPGSPTGEPRAQDPKTRNPHPGFDRRS